MIKQLIAKSFYDGLDNFVKLVLTNVIFVACVVGIFFADKFIYIPLLLIVVSFHLLGTNGIAYGIVRDSGTWLENYKHAIRKTGHFVVFTLGLFVVLIDCFFVAPWYFASEQFVCYIVGFVVLYLALMIALALMYYYPLCLAYEEDKPFETLKKSFAILGDNVLFTILSLLKNIFDLAISVVTVFLLPGFAGISLTQNTAVYFIVLKHQWMEEKKVDKRKASADLFLAQEMEKYQGRNLKHFLFPGK